MIKKIWATIVFVAFISVFSPAVWAAEKGATAANPLNQSLDTLKEELSSYFSSVSGEITSVDGEIVSIDRGSSSSIKTGMRISAYKEGASFTHPVTKEFLGKMEMPIGNVEIFSVSTATAKGRIISGKSADFVGCRVKIPQRKIRLLFYQGNVDWNLGDAYFRTLQDSGRFDLIDTGLQSAGTADILAEAKIKGAEIAVILSGESLKNTVELIQKLFWISDGKQFSDSKTSITLASIKQLKFSAGAFAWKQGEALLTYKLPISAKRMAIGDFRGTGQLDLVLATENRIAIYKIDVDLKLLNEIKLPGSSGEILWIDTIDVNKNGKDEILITTATGLKSTFMAYSSDDDSQIKKTDRPGTVRSFIYSMEGEKFEPVWKGENVFIRALDKNIAYQEYSNVDGFEGSIYTLEFSNGRYAKGKQIAMPKGVNIYDFQFVYAPDGRRGIFAWDENGFINFYNDKGIRTWVSKEDYGGFSDSFKKESRNVMQDKGNWTLKDKFVSANAEVLAPKRKPMFGFINVRSLGYSSSELRSFWWNGITVEERSYLEEVDGSILDYVVVGERLLVLVKPYLLTLGTAKTLLKGENPSGIMLYVFSAKGR
jgi:hypothetical protein